MKPEEATNTVSLAVKVAKLEVLYKRLEQDSISHTESIGNLFDTVAQTQTYASRAAARPAIPPTSNVAVVHGPKPHLVQQQNPAPSNVSMVGEAAAELDANMRPIQRPPLASHNPGRVQEETRGQHQLAARPRYLQNRANDTRGQPGIAVEQQRLQDADQGAGEFQVPREQRRRIERNRKRRETIVMGKKTDDTLQSGSGRATVLVKYVHKQYNTDNIKTYLNKQSIEAQSIDMVSHPESLTKSFKIEIKYEDKSKVMSEDFWPSGIGCRVWRHKQRQQGVQVSTTPEGPSLESSS